MLRGTITASTRRRFVGAGAFAGIPLLAACAGGSGAAGTGGSGAALPAKSEVTVRVHARAGSEDEAYTKRLAEFTAQNKTGIKAIYEGLGDYNVKLVNLIVSGTVGDTMYLLHTNLAYQQYANAGVLRQVEDLMAKDKYDLSAWFPPVRQGMLFDGKQYGLPVRGQIVWNTLFFNPNAIASANLPDPETWTHADMTSNMQKMTRKGSGDTVEAYGAMLGGFGDFSTGVGLMRRFGGELISQDGKQCTINTPACQAAMQWCYDGWHRNRTLLTPVRAPGEGTYDPLGTGKAAMMISAQGGFRADIHKAINGAYKLEFRVMPKGPGNRVGGFLALNTNAISKSSTHVPEAWEVLKWMSDKESSFALTQQSVGSNTPNFRKDTYCDERLLNDPRFSRKSMDAICKGAELPEPDATIWNLRYDEFNKLLSTRMNEVRDNKAEPTTGWLNALRTDLQAILDMPRDTGLGGR
jgi:ABC-type glycerol-3-phosphate transport system substrate-binding protein